MLALVDHDNLSEEVRSHGLVYFADRLLGAIGATGIDLAPAVDIRLYGGWYAENVLTQRAQTLVASLAADFPRPVPTGQKKRPQVVARAELAFSLAAEPNVHLVNTYRRKQARRVACEHPANAGCVNTSCPLLPIHAFFAKKRCPDTGCQIRPTDLVYREEQKLVDTMMSADMFHAATQRRSPLVVVSSDDDLWPAIRTTLLQGITVLHVHTIARRTPQHYCAHVGDSYTQLSL